MPDYKKMYELLYDKEIKRINEEILQIEVKNEMLNIYSVGLFAFFLSFLFMTIVG